MIDTLRLGRRWRAAETVADKVDALQDELSEGFASRSGLEVLHAQIEATVERSLTRYRIQVIAAQAAASVGLAALILFK